MSASERRSTAALDADESGVLPPSKRAKITDDKLAMLVFGGTFSPPHIGHIEIAKKSMTTVEHEGGTKVALCLLSPSNQGYTKPGKLPDKDRLYLTQVAVHEAGDPRIQVATWAACTPEQKKTYEEIAQYKLENQGRIDETYYVGGADWFNGAGQPATGGLVRCPPDFISQLVTAVDGFVVCQRPGYVEFDAEAFREQLIARLGDEGDYKAVVQKIGSLRVVTVQLQSNTSSTAVREAIKARDHSKLGELLSPRVCGKITDDIDEWIKKV